MKHRYCFLLGVMTALSACSPFFSEPTHLQIAEELSRQGRYEEAISHYKQHIEVRLARSNRPDWENPNFYWVLIGDLQLKQNLPEEALTTYQHAEQKGVDANLISDRYRTVAQWYEERNKLGEAVKVLTQRRNHDPLLFDTMLDQLSKEIVRREEAAKEDAATK